MSGAANQALPPFKENVMEASERKARMDLLLRANAGKALKPRLAAELAEALNVLEEEVQFLPLDESDAIREALQSGFQREATLDPTLGGERAMWQLPPDKTTEVAILPASKEVLFLMLQDAYKVGILPVAANVLRRRWTALLDVQPNGFIVMNTDFTCSLVVDRVCEWPRWEDLVEIRAFGDPWVEWLSRQIEP